MFYIYTMTTQKKERTYLIEGRSNLIGIFGFFVCRLGTWEISSTFKRFSISWSSTTPFPSMEDKFFVSPTSKLPTMHPCKSCMDDFLFRLWDILSFGTRFGLCLSNKTSITVMTYPLRFLSFAFHLFHPSMPWFSCILKKEKKINQ